MNFVNIINHTIVLDESSLLFCEKKENFITYGVFSETYSLAVKQEKNIKEIFSQYFIKFDKSNKKLVTFEKEIYSINLHKHNIFKKDLPLKSLNSYKLLSNKKINYIHNVNFIAKEDLINSIYFPFSNLIKQTKTSS